MPLQSGSQEARYSEHLNARWVAAALNATEGLSPST